MRNPKKVTIIIFGLQKQDELQYFIDKQSYIKEYKPPDFPLNQKGQYYGIDVQRLINYVRIKIQLFIAFYNHNSKQFVGMEKLIRDGFIILNMEFCDDQNPLLIRLSLIIDQYQLGVKIKENEKSIFSLRQSIMIVEKQLNQIQILVKELNEKICQIKEKDSSGQKKYDIAILYSHPLDAKVEPVKFNEEIQNFKTTMQNLNKQFTYYITQATKQNFQKVLKQNPKIIHIISHGSINDNLETYLDFEHELEGQTDFCEDKVTEADIYRILQQPLKKRSLIFFGCCHAGNMAQIFHQYGYPTIAINKLLKMEDNVAIAYFQSFYENLIQNFSFQKCHEQAKEYVKSKFKGKDFQSCESHEHSKKCKLLFKEENALSSYIELCCNTEQDKLVHKWDQECQVKKQFKSVLNLKDDQLIEELLTRLDEVVEINKTLKLCCCEIAEIGNYNSDDFQEYLRGDKFDIEHRASNTFQFLGDEKCKIFNFIEDGHLIEQNKIKWQEEYVAYKYNLYKQIVQNLINIFEEKQKSSKIILMKINQQYLNELIIFTQEVINYFKQRYFNQSKQQQIEVLNNINQITQYQESDIIKYIFIDKMNQVEWQNKKEYLLNQKSVIILFHEDIEDDDARIQKIKAFLLDYDIKRIVKLKVKRSIATDNQQKIKDIHRNKI